MLLSAVRKTIEENSLIKRGDTVLCAVSGGADSICLLHVLQSLKSEYNLSLFVANVNHLLRGDESDRDSNFVKSVCKAADVKCFYREYDVAGIARLNKIGEEECGRMLRYEFFQELAEKLGGAKIATAHNLNDNAETVLFRLIRGSSAQGLGGIKYKRDNIIRPLLDVSRAEIENYLKRNGITWCEDSSNKSDVYARNKIRLSVLPRMNEVSHNVERRIVSAAKLIAEDDAFLSQLADNALQVCFSEERLNVGQLLSQPVPIQRRIASYILKHWNTQEITNGKIEAFLKFLEKESGKCFDINSESFAEKTYEFIRLRKRSKDEGFSAFLETGKEISDKNWSLYMYLSEKPVKMNSNCIAVFDAGKIKLPLTVRYRKDGDRMSLKGMRGTKKLSDIFSDEKIDRLMRDSVPVVEMDGEILYIGGIRRSAHFDIDENTESYLVIKYSER